MNISLNGNDAQKKVKKIAAMVYAPDTLADGCSAMDQALEKLQPKLKIQHATESAIACFRKSFPDGAVNIESILTDLAKDTHLCQICTGKLQKQRYFIVNHTINWEELTRVPCDIRTVCENCNKVSNFSEMLEVYLKQSLLEGSEASTDLSLLIEHYLKVNGFKVSEISVFEAVISLNVSLKKSMEALDITSVVPEEREVESLVRRLVSFSSRASK